MIDSSGDGSIEKDEMFEFFCASNEEDPSASKKAKVEEKKPSQEMQVRALLATGDDACLENAV